MDVRNFKTRKKEREKKKDFEKKASETATSGKLAAKLPWH